MLNSTDRMANEKSERDASARAARRAEEASIVAGLRAVLQADEQLLGFARARIAGGIKGRLNIGPEAFFAPFVNVGLTERRFVIQHLHGETGRPSEILPHFFAIADLQTIHFADIETYGGPPASRLVLHLANGQSFRLRLTGESNFASAKALAEVFRSLTSVRKSASGPTQRVCISCKHIMDRPSKFCPYCGVSQMDAETPSGSGSSEAVVESDSASPDIEKVTVVVTEPHADLLDDALEFLRSDPVPLTEPVSELPAEHRPAAFNSPAMDSATDSTVDSSPATGMSSVSNADDKAPGSLSSVDFDNRTAANAPEGVAAGQVGEGPGPAGTFTGFSVPTTWQLSETSAAADSAAEPITAAEPEAVETPNAEANAFHGEQPSSTTEPVPDGPATSETTDFPVGQPGSTGEEAPAPVWHMMPDPWVPTVPANEVTSTIASTPDDHADLPAPSFNESPFTYSEAGSSATNTVEQKEAPPMDHAGTAGKPLRVHFHIQHPAVKFDEVITGRDADDVVSQLKERVVSELKFPVKLYAMRLTPLEFAQEIVSKYNQEERQSLPRPSSCREFLHLVQAIGYATVEDV